MNEGEMEWTLMGNNVDRHMAYLILVRNIYISMLSETGWQYSGDLNNRLVWSGNVQFSSHNRNTGHFTVWILHTGVQFMANLCFFSLVLSNGSRSWPLCAVFEYCVLIMKLLPFDYQTLLCAVFRWIWVLGVWYSDV